MYRITLTGTPSEFGQQQGQILRAAGLRFPPPEPRLLPLAHECYGRLGQHAPALQTELDHLVESAGDTDRGLFTLLLTAPFAQTVPSCSIVAVTPERSTDGRMWIGRNYDYLYDPSRASATTYLSYPTGQLASLGNSDVWVGRGDGLNEAGLFIGLTATFQPGVQPGLAFWFIVRMVLDRCQTVAEAVQLLESLPHAQSRNYLLADRSGSAVVVEASLSGIEVRAPEDGVLVTTNHNLCPALAGKEMIVPPDSPVRYQRLRSLARLERISPQDITAALGDRAARVCAHDVYNGMEYGTIWSVTGCLDDRKLDVAVGVPGGTMEYQTISF